MREVVLAFEKVTVERRTAAIFSTTVRALDGLDFELYADEILAVAGSSGSGKSTLVRAACGLIEPTAGRIAVLGRWWFGGGDSPSAASRAELPRLRRFVQPVFQDPAASLTPHFSAFELIEEGMIIHGLWPKSEREQRVVAVAKAVGLDAESLGRRPKAFSGGQRQRLALARALAVEPRVLLLDEPTSALDVRTRDRVLDLLVELRQRFGLSVVLVSHDLGAIAGRAARVLVLDGGRGVECGETARILEDPAHPTTRALVLAAR